MKTCIFDLDGVICDTAKYHFLAWKALADTLQIVFTESDNEKLKGVSRMDSLEILLSLDEQKRTFTQEEKEQFAEQKNNLYVSYISKMDKNELLPGVLDLLKYCKEQGIKTALGSVSKNAMAIIKGLELEPYFDSIVDGTHVQNAKPDPEVFLLGAKWTGVKPEECVVFEDAFTGIQAAKAAKMKVVGIGEADVLHEADFVISGFDTMNPEQLLAKINRIES